MSRNLKLVIAFFFLTITATYLSSCYEESVSTPPVVLGFDPESGYIGTNVIIFGSGFSEIKEENEVKINNVVATVVSVTGTNELLITVPPGATTGKVTVTVNGKTGASPTNFVVLVPSITSFSPTSGTVGTLVTITGKDFSDLKTNNLVKFNGTTAEIIEVQGTTGLLVVVPQGATTGKITVSVFGQTATSTGDFTISAPTITSFSPLLGTVGTSVTINGSYFAKLPAGNVVKFNNVVATVISSNFSEIVAQVPAGATTGKITVTVDGRTATSANNFEVVE